MSKESDAVTILIMDKEYRVTCPEEEKEELVASANHLSDKMSEIRSSGKVMGVDRIAVMAGLNLAHEAIKSGGLDGEHSQSTANRLNKLNSQIEEALANYRGIEIN
jgi:cell division protein ZapA